MDVYYLRRGGKRQSPHISIVGESAMCADGCREEEFFSRGREIIQ